MAQPHTRGHVQCLQLKAGASKTPPANLGEQVLPFTTGTQERVLALPLSFAPRRLFERNLQCAVCDCTPGLQQLTTEWAQATLELERLLHGRLHNPPASVTCQMLPTVSLCISRCCSPLHVRDKSGLGDI